MAYHCAYTSDTKLPKKKMHLIIIRWYQDIVKILRNQNWDNDAHILPKLKAFNNPHVKRQPLFHIVFDD